MAYYDVDTPKIVLAMVLAVVLVASVILGLVVVYYAFERSAEAAAEQAPPPEKLETLLAGQRKKLDEYGVVDAKKGIVEVPIDRAMELVVAELSQSQTDEAIPDSGSVEGGEEP